MKIDSTEYTAYILDLLEPIGSVRTGKLFGGVGFSYNAIQFAMMMENRLYFVVDDHTRKKYEQSGMLPFSYRTKKGQVLVRRYFEVPEDVLEDNEQFQLWAKEAISVAGNTKLSKKETDRGTDNAIPINLRSILK